MLYLDFEKPVAEIAEKLTKLEKTKLENKNDELDIEIVEARSKLIDKKKEVYKNLTAWQHVQLSRHPNRPYTLDYIRKMTTDFEELHGDRIISDDKAIIGGLAKIDGISVMIIGHQKGRNAKFKQFRNFGMPSPDGNRKALRLMQLAEKFNIPIITLIDTPGASPGINAEKRGHAMALARNFQQMIYFKVPIIATVIGEGTSGSALSLAIADDFLMMEYAWFGIMTPETCSSVLWKGYDNVEDAAEQMKLTAQELLKAKIIDGIIKEPLGGAHYDHNRATENLKKELVKRVKNLSQLSAQERIKKRMDKYLAIGSIQ